MKINSIKIACVIGVSLMLSACMSPEEHQAMLQQKCSGYGFTPGTNAYAECMQRQDNLEAQNDMMMQNNMQQQRAADALTQMAAPR